MDDLGQLEVMHKEHEAWRAVCEELEKRGVGDINIGGADESLWAAIVRWGEELAQLRLNDPDPDHAADALEGRRSAYPLESDKE